MEKIHLNITVSGLVQGVWFRKYTKDKANELGVNGFVKNESDGYVYIEVEGFKRHIDNFKEWLFTGSPLSIVSSVDHKTGEFNDFDTFEIKR